MFGKLKAFPWKILAIPAKVEIISEGTKTVSVKIKEASQPDVAVLEGIRTI